MITLPDRMSAAGIKARLFLCECPGPSDLSYTPENAAEAISLMDVVVRNRAWNPRSSMAAAPSVLAVVRAPKQFAGFADYPNISPSLLTRIRDILNIANNERDLRSPSYQDFVHKAVAVAHAASNADPSPGKLMAWRTQNHPSPGAGFVLFKTVLKREFYYKVG